MKKTALSMLDLVSLREGGTVAQALATSLRTVQHAEALGFTRYWLAEHHNMASIASSATAVLVGYIAGATQRRRAPLRSGILTHGVGEKQLFRPADTRGAPAGVADASPACPRRAAAGVATWLSPQSNHTWIATVFPPDTIGRTVRTVRDGFCFRQSQKARFRK